MRLFFRFIVVICIFSIFINFIEIFAIKFYFEKKKMFSFYPVLLVNVIYEKYTKGFNLYLLFEIELKFFILMFELQCIANWICWWKWLFLVLALLKYHSSVKRKEMIYSQSKPISILSWKELFFRRPHSLYIYFVSVYNKRNDL